MGEPIGYDFKFTEHINVQELKALTDEVQRRSMRGDHDMRIVMACDSRVVVGAAAKRRSSSRVLSKHLRRLCSICVAHGLQFNILWAGIHINPSGAAPQFAPLPLPNPQPAWMQDVVDREPQDIAAKGSRGGMCGAAVLSRVAGFPGCTAVRKRTPAAERISWAAALCTSRLRRECTVP